MRNGIPNKNYSFANPASRRVEVNPQVEKSIAEGVRIAHDLKKAVARMVSTFNSFVEKQLRVALDTLGCEIEDLSLKKYPYEFEDIDGFIESKGIVSGKIELFVKDVHVMTYYLKKVSEDEYECYAIPPISEDETQIQ